MMDNLSAEDISSKPAVKLLDFYRALLSGEGEGALSAPIDVRKTEKTSLSMDTLDPISCELMENWLNQWGY